MSNPKTELTTPTSYVKEVPQERFVIETDRGICDIGLRALTAYAYKDQVTVVDEHGNTLIFGKLEGGMTKDEVIAQVRNTLEAKNQKYFVVPEGKGVIATSGINGVSKVSNDKVLIVTNDHGKNVLFWTGTVKQVNDVFNQIKSFIKGEVDEIHWG